LHGIDVRSSRADGRATAAQLGIGGAIFWYLKTRLYPAPPSAAEPERAGAPEPLLARLDAEAKHTSGAYWRGDGDEAPPRRPG